MTKDSHFSIFDESLQPATLAFRIGIVGDFNERINVTTSLLGLLSTTALQNLTTKCVSVDATLLPGECRIVQNEHQEAQMVNCLFQKVTSGLKSNQKHTAQGVGCARAPVYSKFMVE